jgi:hypothetical protein
VLQRYRPGAGEALSVVFNWERIVSLDCKILHCCIPPEQIKGSMRAAATLKREELFFHLISRDHENKGSLCPSSSEQRKETDRQGKCRWRRYMHAWHEFWLMYYAPLAAGSRADRDLMDGSIGAYPKLISHLVILRGELISAVQCSSQCSHHF